MPIDLHQQVQFVGGGSDALLFRADGSVRADNAAGPSGVGVLTVTGLTWQMTVLEPNTQLTKLITITRNGRVTIDQ